MSFEILDHRSTELGELMLRRRFSPAHGTLVWEVVLDGEFLMSSAVCDAEIELARIGLAGCPPGATVVVGGLGLGHTAAAVLDHPAVARLVVIELLPAVLEWHRDGLVPLGPSLCDDPRCELVQGDFFEIVPGSSETYEAILLDIDHSPEALLHARHGVFYDGPGLARLGERLRHGGVFALWSADPPEKGFLARLRGVFPDVSTREVTFEVPHLDMTDTNTIVVARS